MKGDGIAKLYDTLSVDERFRLRIQALARRDMVDCERLDRACSPFDLREYTARIEASDVLTLCALVDLMPKLAKLQMVAALRPLVEHLERKLRDAAWLGYLNGYTAGWQAAGRRGEPPTIADDDLDAAAKRVLPDSICFSDVLDEIERAVAASARVPRDGLATFAEERLGLSFDVLLDAWGHRSAETVAAHADVLNAAPVDHDKIQLHLRVLDLAWRKHGLLDRSVEPDDDLREAIRGEGWDVP